MATPSTGFQGLINSFEVGSGRTLLRGMFLTLFVVAMVVFRIHARFRGFTDPSAMEQAQLARNLAGGDGYVTRCIRPTDVWFMTSRDRQPSSPAAWPDTRNAPAYPAALSLAMKIARPSFGITAGTPVFSAEKTVVLPLAILCMLGTGLLVFLLARRIFGPYAALMATLVFFLAETVLAAALSGTAAPLATFLVTGAAHAAVCCLDARTRERPVYAWAIPLVLSALLGGAAILTRYALFAVIPLLVVLVGAAFQRGRLSAILAFLVLAGAVVAPWCVRNVKVSGLPFGNAPYTMLNDTVLHEGDAFDRAVAPTLRNALTVRALQIKAVSNMVGIWQRELFATGSGLMMALFLVSFLHRFANPLGNVLRWAVGAGGVALLFAGGLTEPGTAELLLVLYPLVAAVGAAFFFDAVARIEFLDPAWHPVIMWVVVALVGAPAITNTFRAPPQAAYPPYFPPYAAFAATQVEGEELLATDIPWATAWYGNAPSILIPRSVDELQKLDASPLELGALYLTTETSDRAYASELAGGPYRSWLPVLNGREPRNPGFRFKHAVALLEKTCEQILLVPDTRWGEGEGDQSSVISDQSSVISDPSSVTGDQLSATGDQSSVTGDQSSVTGNRSSVISGQSSVTGDH